MNETPRTVSPNPGQTARKVLVIRLGEREPFISALGAVNALRRAHPFARFDLLTGPTYKAFAEACPYFDRVDTGGMPKDARLLRNLAARTVSERYDIVYDFETSEASARLFQRIAKTRGPTPVWSGHARKCALPHDRADRDSMPPLDRLADQLRHAGLAMDADGDGDASGPPDLVPDLKWIAPVLGDPPRLQPAYFSLDRTFMIYAPLDGPCDKALRWPLERHVEITRRIAEAGVQPVIVGGPGESAAGQAIAQAVQGAKNLTGRTDIFQLATLCQKALFALGVSREPVQMAAVAGRPTLLLLSERLGDPHRDRPQGALSIVIHGETLRKIATDDVWRAIIALGILPSASPGA